MKNFSDELAKRGLGLGIYTAHGNLTCQKFPGSLGYEKQDAATYDSWNVQFVKNGEVWYAGELELTPTPLTRCWCTRRLVLAQRTEYNRSPKRVQCDARRVGCPGTTHCPLNPLELPRHRGTRLRHGRVLSGQRQCQCLADWRGELASKPQCPTLCGAAQHSLCGFF